MKKIILFTLILLTIPTCTAQEQPSYWSQFKNTAQGAGRWLINKYKRYGIPHPRRIGIENFEGTFNGESKFFTVYKYDTSKDTNAVKDIRKELDLSGIYAVPESDLKLYNRLHPTKQLPQQLADCMKRLLIKGMNDGIITLNDNAKERVFMQLLWELEDALPETFNNDENGDEFIKFVHQMFISSSLEDLKLQKGLLYFLISWEYYTLRFNNKKGLLAAIKLSLTRLAKEWK